MNVGDFIVLLLTSSVISTVVGKIMDSYIAKWRSKKDKGQKLYDLSRPEYLEYLDILRQLRLIMEKILTQLTLGNPIPQNILREIEKLLSDSELVSSHIRLIGPPRTRKTASTASEIRKIEANLTVVLGALLTPTLLIDIKEVETFSEILDDWYDDLLQIMREDLKKLL